MYQIHPIIYTISSTTFGAVFSLLVAGSRLITRIKYKNTRSSTYEGNRVGALCSLVIQPQRENSE